MIRERFKSKKPLFIPFLVAGHPTISETVEAILTLANVGADVIELGVPFSDPVADGTTIQRASIHALSHNTSLETVFDIIKNVRQRGCLIPIILFSYYNPIFAMEEHTFAQKAREAGVNGVLIVDLPAEEGINFYTLLQNEGLEIILLASPTTNPNRFALYKKLKPAFLYYVSRLSVTGVQSEISASLQNDVQQCRHHLPHTPICVGFGISTSEHAATIASFAEGFIVGSYLVDTLEKGGLVDLEQAAKTFILETT